MAFQSFWQKNRWSMSEWMGKILCAIVLHNWTHAIYQLVVTNFEMVAWKNTFQWLFWVELQGKNNNINTFLFYSSVFSNHNINSRMVWKRVRRKNYLKLLLSLWIFCNNNSTITNITISIIIRGKPSIYVTHHSFLITVASELTLSTIHMSNKKNGQLLSEISTKILERNTDFTHRRTVYGLVTVLFKHELIFKNKLKP